MSFATKAAKGVPGSPSHACRGTVPNRLSPLASCTCLHHPCAVRGSVHRHYVTALGPAGVEPCQGHTVDGEPLSPWMHAFPWPWGMALHCIRGSVLLLYSSTLLSVSPGVEREGPSRGQKGHRERHTTLLLEYCLHYIDGHDDGSKQSANLLYDKQVESKGRERLADLIATDVSSVSDTDTDAGSDLGSDSLDSNDALLTITALSSPLPAENRLPL